MAYPSQLGFQDAASPVMEELLHFHDHALMVVFLISALVLYMLVALATTKLYNKYILDSQEVEMIWTILPAVILIMIALPSLRILYLMDEINNPSLTVKAIGHQWYWSYEYTDQGVLEFNSYMIPTGDLTSGQYRLLDVDHRMLVPTETSTRLLASADDVIHSWAVQSLGIKIDAIPGRLNQVALMVSHPGVFYGQCSEICGANHSFMPIVVEALPMPYYKAWLTSQLLQE